MIASHTINMNIIDNILSKLENDNNIHIIYAVEAGSRVTGLNSVDSDYDIRFIFCYKDTKKYISLEPLSDTITGFSSDRVYDWHGWDILKTLKSLKESNPSILEWLYSSIIYRDDGFFKKSCIDITNMMHTGLSLMYHYKSMAYTTWMTHIGGKATSQEEVNRKKYFYVIRPICILQYLLEQYVEKDRTTDDDHINFEIDTNKILETLKSKIKVEAYDQILSLIEEKRLGNKLDESKRCTHIDDWIMEQFERFDAINNRMDKNETFTVQSTISLFKKLTNDYKKVIALGNKDGVVNRTEYLNLIGTFLQFTWLQQHPTNTYKQIPQKIHHILENVTLPNNIVDEIKSITIVENRSDDALTQVQTEAGKQLLNIWIKEPVKKTCILLALDEPKLIDQIDDGKMVRDDMIDYLSREIIMPLFFILNNPNERIPNRVQIEIPDQLNNVIKDNKIKRYNRPNEILNNYVKQIIDDNVEFIESKHKQLINIRDELTKHRYNNSIQHVPKENFEKILYNYVRL